jgi:hypothetical protein
MNACVFTADETVLRGGAARDCPWRTHCDLIIAVGEGTRVCASLGFTPDIVIPARPEGGAADARAGVENAFARGCTQVTLLGSTDVASGPAAGNAALAACHPGTVAVTDGRGFLLAVDATQRCKVEGAPGMGVALAAWEGPATVSVTGLRRALTRETLRPDTASLRDELAGTHVGVRVVDGVVLLHVERPMCITAPHAVSAAGAKGANPPCPTP